MEQAQKENKVTHKPETQLAAAPQFSKQQMAEMAGVSVEDAAPVRLILLQGASDSVKAKGSKLRCGDIVKTGLSESDAVVVGGYEEAVEIIPVSNYKTLLIEDMTDPKKPKWIRSEPVTANNEGARYEDLENGIPIRRTLCFNVFCLLAHDLDAGPVTIRFKSSSLKTGGRPIASHMYKMIQINQLPFSRTLMLGSDEDSNGEDMFAIFTVDTGNPCTPAQLQAAAECMKSVPVLKRKVTRWTDSSVSAPVHVIQGSPEDMAKL